MLPEYEPESGGKEPSAVIYLKYSARAVTSCDEREHIRTGEQNWSFERENPSLRAGEGFPRMGDRSVGRLWAILQALSFNLF
jgi:hypothetical protein